MDLIKKIYKKLTSKEVIAYIIFGVSTTAINLISFFVLNSLLHINENISNFVAIILSILFAYFTNRKWVFNTKAQGFKENFLEFLKFIAGRTFTMVIEFFGCMFLFTLPILHIISKIIISVIVIILNYFISKFFAFKKHKKSTT